MIGIYLSQNYDLNNISGNIAYSNTVYGIRIFRSDDNFVWNNTVIDNRHGIYLDESVINDIIENNITDNTNTGLTLDSSNNNILYKNKFKDNRTIGLEITNNKN